MTTVSVCGGYWVEGEMVGIALRNMFNSSISAAIDGRVASRKNKNSLSRY